jgi:hypothetical protein
LNWSPYVLLLSGACAFFLASNAFQAGSLAASQPGLTVVDPLVASLLGVVLFGERLNHHPAVFAGEVLAAGVLLASVIMLSRSPLVQEEVPLPAPLPPLSEQDTFIVDDSIPAEWAQPTAISNQVEGVPIAHLDSETASPRRLDRTR